MIRTVKGAARRVRNAATVAWEKQTLGRLYSDAAGNLDPELHLREAIDWLRRAQDAGNDRGFSYGTRLGGGFLPSYPETTGYIIPTLLRAADARSNADLEERAIEAADWEIDVQMTCGAVMAGRVTEKPRPAVFNTGQVLLGWVAVFERTREDRFQAAARRAADWLLEMQEPGGEWIRGNSPLANPRSTVYNVKAAWGLCRAGIVFENPAWVQGALRNAEQALRHQTDNGWFSCCCLTDPDRPLLHTLAYTLQGLVGIGLLTGRSEFLSAAAASADALIRLMDGGGFIPGRITADFQGAVDWCCLTGSAQMSVVWAQLYGITGKEHYREACACVNRYLLAHHDVSSRDPAIRGGVAGSWPVWGEYGQYMVLNWATKFFVDALLAERGFGQRSSSANAVMG
ncbi:MAG: hypothetical protein NTV05_11635 [Acidobacteria bacterium]|nr:hypothetical protein [Acidobacteriota bacterium]